VPFKSRQQQRYFFAAEAAGKLPPGTAREWAEETDFEKLPQRVKEAKPMHKQAGGLGKLVTKAKKLPLPATAREAILPGAAGALAATQVAPEGGVLGPLGAAAAAASLGTRKNRQIVQKALAGKATPEAMDALRSSARNAGAMYGGGLALDALNNVRTTSTHATNITRQLDPQGSKVVPLSPLQQLRSALPAILTRKSSADRSVRKQAILGQALLGSGIGAVTAGSGNRAEGAGRGLAIGGGTGLGMFVGDRFGGAAADGLSPVMIGADGQPTVKSLLGNLAIRLGSVGLGGFGGYQGTQALLGPPSWETHDKVKKSRRKRAQEERGMNGLIRKAAETVLRKQAVILPAIAGTGIGAATAPSGHRGEGAARGLGIGTGTGLGMFAGGRLGALLAQNMGNPYMHGPNSELQVNPAYLPMALALTLGGTALGGVGGYKGTQAMLGAPSWDKKKSKPKPKAEKEPASEEKKSAADNLIEARLKLDAFLTKTATDGFTPAIRQTAARVKRAFDATGNLAHAVRAIRPELSPGLARQVAAELLRRAIV